ncbi:MAG: haloacid dehalogenase [Leptothrix sp. (in: Bacteria)]|nr:haloacid dehalogenase [Leptothrix sp. (in: b-proteobacteria)]
MKRVWLFDLDDTLHDAARASMPQIRDAMGEYIVNHLGFSRADAEDLRTRHWHRYGATLLGLVKLQGVDAAHFLRHTHVLPGLEERVRGHRGDLAALRRLPGRKVILTNAPAAYAARVLGVLGITRLFDHILSIEDMRMFGHLRPKPDTRMLRAVAVRLRVPPSQCVLVEDTLVHQKAARQVGMDTVWMQRWLGPRGLRLLRRPAYVGQRVRSLRTLF